MTITTFYPDGRIVTHRNMQQRYINILITKQSKVITKAKIVVSEDVLEEPKPVEVLPSLHETLLRIADHVNEQQLGE